MRCLLKFVTLPWLLAAVLALPLLAELTGREREIAATARAEEEKVFEQGVVAADHPLAAQAGLEMLKQGGNAVDAAAATSFALSVVRPYSSGMGGGGFMVIWDAQQQKAVALDYRERAPAAAHRNLFLEAEDPDLPLDVLSHKGILAVGVPGTVAGLSYAVEHYGQLDLKTVLQPAIRLAREGYQIDAYDRTMHENVLGQFQQNPVYRERFAALYEQYLHDGQLPDLGQRVTSPQLAALELIARDGPDAFYRGPIAQAIVKLSEEEGGLLTADDLAAMQPVVRQPLRGTFEQWDVLTMPPPSSGGVALLQILNTLTAWEEQHPDHRLQGLDENHPDSIHVLVEAMKHAFADRAEFLADADFVEVPIERLISAEYAAQIAEQIELQRTYDLDHYGRYFTRNGGTSHLSVIDRQGNAVACTETVNLLFGSLLVEPTYGIVLNNEMDDFATRPGEPNVFGLIQGEQNAVEPGKKPLSSMTPTILVRDGKATHALGGSGGPRIISATLQVLLQMTRFDQTPVQAVRQPRFHHQWMPDRLFVEPPLLERIREPLERRGHELQRREDVGVVQAVARDHTGVRGAADPRKGGAAAGH